MFCESENKKLKYCSNILGLTYASYFAETISNYPNINLTHIKRRKPIDVGGSSICPSPSCSEMAPFCLKQQRTEKILLVPHPGLSRNCLSISLLVNNETIATLAYK